MGLWKIRHGSVINPSWLCDKSVMALGLLGGIRHLWRLAIASTGGASQWRVCYQRLPSSFTYADLNFFWYMFFGTLSCHPFRSHRIKLLTKDGVKLTTLSVPIQPGQSRHPVHSQLATQGPSLTAGYLRQAGGVSSTYWLCRTHSTLVGYHNLLSF